MPALAAGIHVRTWMAGTNPAMAARCNPYSGALPAARRRSPCGEPQKLAVDGKAMRF